ncbi:calsenilin-like [Crassostrea virginica]
MNFPFLLICLSVGIGITEGTQKQKFPCDFNIYDSVQDGRITSEEFFTFTHKHGYDGESSDIFFKTMDSNADGQIGVSEFREGIPNIRNLGLLGRCTGTRVVRW